MRCSASQRILVSFVQAMDFLGVERLSPTCMHAPSVRIAGNSSTANRMASAALAKRLTLCHEQFGRCAVVERHTLTLSARKRNGSAAGKTAQQSTSDPQREPRARRGSIRKRLEKPVMRGCPATIDAECLLARGSLC
jgi:hypothetical protein